MAKVPRESNSTRDTVFGEVFREMEVVGKFVAAARDELGNPF